MIIHNCEQGSEEWFAVKCGKISASHFKDVLCQGDEYEKYMRRVLSERMSGETHPSSCNKAMKNGTKLEPQARACYERSFGKVNQVGFVEMNEYVGCSPDGLIGDDGGLEIKCPYPSTHIDYILKNRMPSVYVPQVQGSLWVTGRKWWDFASFCPQIKDNPLWFIRVERDEKKINVLSIAVETFIQEMIEMEIKVKNNSMPF